MKRIIITALSLMLSINCFCQEIAESKIDDFTNHTVIRTTWESFSKKDIWIYTRVSKLDSFYMLGFKIMPGRVAAIDEGKILYIKLMNDSIIKLYNSKYTISCSGCGAVTLLGADSPGLEITFYPNDDEIEILKNIGIKKVRIYFTDGYQEAEIKEKCSEIIKNGINLVSKTIVK